MELLTKFAVFFFLSFQILTTGCNSKPAADANKTGNVGIPANSSNASNHNSDNIDDLRALVQVSFEPEDLTWRTMDAGQGKKRLIAVFLLTPESYRAFASKYTQGGKDAQVNVEPWFPAELTAMSEISGGMTVAGKAFPATEFFRPPFTAGNIILIPDTHYAILDIQSE